MKAAIFRAFIAVVFVAAAFCSRAASADDWMQFGYDAAHSGNNAAESTISAANVAGLRQRYQVTLPASVDSAPVYLSHVLTGSGTKDLLFLLSLDGTVMALDAVDGTVVWSHQVPGQLPTMSSPAIDPDRAYVYAYGLDGFVHKYEVGNGSEVTTGGWPELVTLKPDVERVAGGLTIATSATTSYLYVVTNSFFDGGDYQGHLTTIDLASGNQNVFNTLCSDNPTHLDHAGNDCAWPSKNPEGGNGIWGRGGATFDAKTNRLYVTSGNGWFDANMGGYNWGDSVLSLRPDGAGTLGLPDDNYTPSNYMDFDALDLGSVSLAILPVRRGKAVSHLGAQLGKDRMIRVIDLDNMNGTHVVGSVGGELEVIGGGGLFTQPAVWTDAQGDTWLMVANKAQEAFKLQFDVDGTPSLQLQWDLYESFASPIVANGVLYFSSSGSCVPPPLNCMMAVDPTTGNVLWTSDTFVAPTHWQSHILVNGALYALDGSDLHRFDLTLRVVTPISGPGGSLSPGDPQTVEEGDTVTFNVSPDVGYLIASVTGCGIRFGPAPYWTTEPITEDCTVSATFVSDTDEIFRDDFDGTPFKQSAKAPEARGFQTIQQAAGSRVEGAMP